MTHSELVVSPGSGHWALQWPGTLRTRKVGSPSPQLVADGPCALTETAAPFLLF